jgi:hypothetical protein
MENILGVVGPLATCIQDIRIFQEVLLLLKLEEPVPNHVLGCLGE